MLTRITIRNFKQFGEAEVELGSPVVFIGPNDSGKTSALQALALWDLGLRRWSEKRTTAKASERRKGVAINRKDFVGAPVPSARLLWRDLHVRSNRTDASGHRERPIIRVEIIVEGTTAARSWTCGLEFGYENDESLVVRPLSTEGDDEDRLPVPEEALGFPVVFLQTMSGIVPMEDKLEPGSINVRLGEGRTAEVLRNLCYQLLERPDGATRFDLLANHMKSLFGVEISEPELVVERGEVQMGYRDRNGIRLDLSSSGRGMQQTLLLLSFLYLNPGSVVLLDEPDAHLEILRQRETYDLLTRVAQEQGSQIVMASHSEVILNEAADRDTVVAFVGRPHRMDDRGSQVRKALTSLGFEQYYQAELTGWVLFLEGSTDLAVLKAFADRLGHEAADCLRRPFVQYVGNQPSKARDTYFGLREAYPSLRGLALFDRLENPLDAGGPLSETMWKRREIENYLCQPDTLIAWAEAEARNNAIGPLFEEAEVQPWSDAMRQCIADRVPPAALRDLEDRYWLDVKASDDLLDPIFQAFGEHLGLRDVLRKTDYHRLALHVAVDQIDADVGRVLDSISATGRQAVSSSDS